MEKNKQRGHPKPRTAQTRMHTAQHPRAHHSPRFLCRLPAQQEQELEAMKARLADMEKEAAKLKEMQVGRDAACGADTQPWEPTMCCAKHCRN